MAFLARTVRSAPGLTLSELRRRLASRDRGAFVDEMAKACALQTIRLSEDDRAHPGPRTHGENWQVGASLAAQVRSRLDNYSGAPLDLRP